MTLRDADRAALVAHLAQRFPGWGARADVARAAGLGDAQLTGEARQSWTAIVALSCERGQVARLLSSAAHARPGDAMLADLAAQAEVGELRVPRADDPRQWVIGAAIAGVVVLVLGILALAGDLAGLSAPADAASTPAEAASSTEGEGTEVPGASSEVPGASTGSSPGVTERVAARLQDGSAPPLPDSESVGEAEASADTDPSVQAETPVDAAPEAEPVTDDAPAAASTSSPCPGPADEVVGYAYAGRSAPSGSTWTLPRSLNVRVDYPRRDNGWSSRARVVCTLRKGTRLRLDPPPVPVDGGAFWVPVRPGNVH